MKAMLMLLLVCVASAARADVPFQFAAPDLRAPDDPYVNGIRFSVIEGRNQRIRGADFGFLSLSETSELSGFSAVFGVGRLTGNLRGCASGAVNIHEGIDRGLNAAFVNLVHTMRSGANVGFANVTDDYSMVDVGGLNTSARSTVQVGFVNVTRRIESVQIGFINVADNGFLPVFPFFNFPKN